MKLTVLLLTSGFLLQTATSQAQANREVSVMIDGDSYSCLKGAGTKIYFYHQSCQRGQEVGFLIEKADRIENWRNCVAKVSPLLYLSAGGRAYVTRTGSECVEIYEHNGQFRQAPQTDQLEKICSKIFP